MACWDVLDFNNHNQRMALRASVTDTLTYTARNDYFKSTYIIIKGSFLTIHGSSFICPLWRIRNLHCPSRIRLMPKSVMLSRCEILKTGTPSDENFGKPVFINKALLWGWRDYLVVKQKHSWLLKRTQIQFQTPTGQLKTTFKQCTKRSSHVLFCPPWAPGMHVIQIHTWRPTTHTHKIKI